MNIYITGKNFHYAGGGGGGTNKYIPGLSNVELVFVGQVSSSGLDVVSWVNLALKNSAYSFFF